MGAGKPHTHTPASLQNGAKGEWFRKGDEGKGVGQETAQAGPTGNGSTIQELSALCHEYFTLKDFSEHRCCREYFTVDEERLHFHAYT